MANTSLLKRRLMAVGVGLAVLIWVGGLGFLAWYYQNEKPPEGTIPSYFQKHGNELIYSGKTRTPFELIAVISFVVFLSLATVFGVLLSQKDPIALRARDWFFLHFKRVLRRISRLLASILYPILCATKTLLRWIERTATTFANSSFGSTLKERVSKYQTPIFVLAINLCLIPFVFGISHSTAGRLSFICIVVAWVLFLAHRSRGQS